MRNFRSPNGRHWSVSLYYLPTFVLPGLHEFKGIASPAVLRFRSDDLTLDLNAWPDDWNHMGDAALVELLREAQAPQLGLRLAALQRETAAAAS